jgi:hypothetical protein
MNVACFANGTWVVLKWIGKKLPKSISREPEPHSSQHFQTQPCEHGEFNGILMGFHHQLWRFGT